jgi:hypothetical protein
MRSWQAGSAGIPGLPTLSVGDWLTTAVFVLLTVVSYSVVLAGTHQAARSETVSVGAALREGVSRSPALLGVIFLGILAIWIGLLLLIVPGIYLMIVFYLAFLLPVVERMGAVASLSRAGALVKGAWWRTAGLMTVVSLILIALAVAVSLIVGLGAVAVGGMQSLGRQTPGITMAAALVMAPLLPLGFCLTYAVYTDLRLRRDGRDLVARARRVGV